MAKVLLINPSENKEVFKDSKIGIAVPFFPSLSLAALAAVLIESSHEVKIADLRIMDISEFKHLIYSFKPHFVGITFTTPLFDCVSSIIKLIRKISPNSILLAGGAHVSALPEDSLKNLDLDIVCVGEGEITLDEIVKGKPLKEINGIFYKDKSGIIHKNPPRPLIGDLDKLPMPAWHLFDIKKYNTSKLSCKKNPLGAMETSRGCPFGCVYCSKQIFGRCFRKKSVKRVVDEMQNMLDIGFGEIHILDDMFATDLKRAKEICDEIIKRGLVFPWSLINGIRIDFLDEELMNKLKRAGCYRVAFGVESGDDNILKLIDKSLTIEKIKKGFKIANKSGIETVAFCMMGLPGETPQTMQKTIDLMKVIKPTIPKVSILLPLPGTKIFNEWDKKGLILTKNWSNYSFHSSKRIYKHPNLSNEEILFYYNKFWRSLFLSPEFILRRLIRGIKTGEVFYDFYYFIKSLSKGW